MWGDKTTVPQDWYREGELCGKGVANKALPAPPLLALLRSQREPRACGPPESPCGGDAAWEASEAWGTMWRGRAWGRSR